MDVLQAAVLAAKLPFLERLNNTKRGLADLYQRGLDSLIQLQKPQKKGLHVYRDFVILGRERDRLKTFLGHVDIETKVRYGIPLHLTAYYRRLGYKKGDLPITEDTCAHVLHLPCRMGMDPESIRRICRFIKMFYSGANTPRPR
jgi:dTDP-4-amino-4,6-dideoxygalactose transaminase